MESDALSFASSAQLDGWLQANYATTNELWVRIFKKGSGTPSVTWNDCVVVAISWGWIDGLRKALDDESYLQRLTPRRSRSNWSKRNCEIAERLIADSRMQPAGLAHVEAARSDGRWDRAYAGSAQMVIPDDFLAALKSSPAAAKFYETLNRRNLFAIYHRLQTAKRPETRARRIVAIIEQLARREGF